MAQCDAAGVNGSNRILFHGAPRLRMMPNGCLGSPVLVLLFGLDRGFLMDVGLQRAGPFGLRAEVEATGARNAVAYRSRMPDLFIRVTELIENRLTTEPPGEM